MRTGHRTDNQLLQVRMGTAADYERVVAAMDKVNACLRQSCDYLSPPLSSPPSSSSSSLSAGPGLIHSSTR